jgi:GT2 family glycosyltransferase
MLRKIKKNVAAIVVTYNGKKWYDRCFQSLLLSSVPLEVIVVDNKSTDDSASYITNKFPGIKVIQSDENLGFAKANNIGLNIARNNNADYFFLLNQDAWVEHDTIEALIAAAEKKLEFGILSPIHLTADKNCFDKNFKDYFYSCSDTVNAYENLYLKKHEPILYETRFVNAAAWLITKKCIETVGGFDTVLFKHYGEDANYCQRVLFHNLKIGIVPSVTVCHDRADRIDKPHDPSIGYAVIHGNVSLIPKTYFKYLVKMFIKTIYTGEVKKCAKEIFWVIKNFKKIVKSKKTNKIAGKGLKYIESFPAKTFK